MRLEYEAKFFYDDIDRLRARLEKSGGVLTKPRHLQVRCIFANEVLEKNNAWLRLRKEYSSITLTWKKIVDPLSVDGAQEIAIAVSDFDGCIELLQNLGLRKVRYQENYREEWELGGVIFDFDTWPSLPTFLEIEGENESAVREAARILELDYATARFGTVDDVYLKELGRDILGESELVFDQNEK